MSDVIWVAVISIGGSLFLALPGILAWVGQRKKEKADVSKIYANGFAEAAKREIEQSDVIRSLKNSIQALEGNFDDLVDVVVSWSDGIDSLTTQLKKFEEPCWRPRESHRLLVKKLVDARQIVRDAANAPTVPRKV